MARGASTLGGDLLPFNVTGAEQKELRGNRDSQNRIFAMGDMKRVELRRKKVSLPTSISPSAVHATVPVLPHFETPCS